MRCARFVFRKLPKSYMSFPPSGIDVPVKPSVNAKRAGSATISVESARGSNADVTARWKSPSAGALRRSATMPRATSSSVSSLYCRPLVPVNSAKYSSLMPARPATMCSSLSVLLGNDCVMPVPSPGTTITWLIDGSDVPNTRLPNTVNTVPAASTMVRRKPVTEPEPSAPRLPLMKNCVIDMSPTPSRNTSARSSNLAVKYLLPGPNSPSPRRTSPPV
mmetsp:Transcript_676/g.1558  ORF Transcript_676/g.1558 Transcript_676/m.1558 type:complete len:219 (-) Transcript_676:1604-2260(-)